VGSYLLEDLKTLDSGSWYGDSFKAEPVPTLEEVFLQMPEDFLIYVEMKVRGFGAWALAHEVAKLIARHRRWESTMVASFNSLAVRFVRNIDDRIIRGYIWSGNHPLPLRRRWLVPMAQPYWLAPDRGTLTPELLRKLQQQGHPVAAWDLDAGSDLGQLMAMKLDGAVTNHPEVLVEQRRQLS
jgi:glycerophosphoryl diester phosphodiesterase